MGDSTEQDNMADTPGPVDPLASDIEACEGRFRRHTQSSTYSSMTSYEKLSWHQRCHVWCSYFIYPVVLLVAGCCVWLVIACLQAEAKIAELQSAFEQQPADGGGAEVTGSPRAGMHRGNVEPGIPLGNVGLLALRRETIRKVLDVVDRKKPKNMEFNDYQGLLSLSIPANTADRHISLNVLRKAKFMEAKGDIIGNIYDFNQGEITVRETGVYAIFAQLTFHQAEATNHARIRVGGTVVSHCMSSKGYHETCTLFTLRLIRAGKKIDLTVGASTGKVIIGVEQDGTGESLSQLAVLKLASVESNADKS